MKTYYIKFREEFTAEIVAEDEQDANNLMMKYQKGEEDDLNKGVVQLVVDKFELLSKATEQE